MKLSVGGCDQRKYSTLTQDERDWRIPALIERGNNTLQGIFYLCAGQKQAMSKIGKFCK